MSRGKTHTANPSRLVVTTMTTAPAVKKSLPTDVNLTMAGAKSRRMNAEMNMALNNARMASLNPMAGIAATVNAMKILTLALHTDKTSLLVAEVTETSTGNNVARNTGNAVNNMEVVARNTASNGRSAGDTVVDMTKAVENTAAVTAGKNVVGMVGKSVTATAGKSVAATAGKSAVSMEKTVTAGRKGQPMEAKKVMRHPMVGVATEVAITVGVVRRVGMVVLAMRVATEVKGTVGATTAAHLPLPPRASGKPTAWRECRCGMGRSPATTAVTVATTIMTTIEEN